jgi:hypothetical protein
MVRNMMKCPILKIYDEEGLSMSKREPEDHAENSETWWI